MSEQILFSFLIPTRKRSEKLKRLFESIFKTTENLSRLEIVLAIDEDDDESLQVSTAGLNVKHVIIPPSKTMGYMNRTCYEASSGKYVMLLNDDVILQTLHWDTMVEEVFRQYEKDEIVLVHVNDLIFREKLCTFPFLSRTYCELVGNICPEEYIRYRIDDHIYNIFNMLAYIGYYRIIYLPNVIFEHDNYLKTELGQREYVPNPEIIEKDILFFDQTLQVRKDLVSKLAHHIENKKIEAHLHSRCNPLNDLLESYSIRKTEYVRTNNGEKLNSETARVTVGVVSAGIKSEHAAKCIDSIKKYTSNYDLIILDNNRGPNFNHPREMNRIISVAKTDYLVLMDDDVFVEEDWLNGLLGSLSSDVGVVTPLHKDKNGELSYSGVFLMLNGTGEHAHIIDIPSEPRSIPTLCSAIMLIDLNKCRHLLFNERNRKYFLDIDYGLQVWEAGYRVVCTPETTITHIGGGTLTQGSSAAMVLHKPDEDIFIEDWIKSGRLKSVEDGIWQRDTYVQATSDLSKEVLRLLAAVEFSDDLALLINKMEQVLSKCNSFPYLRQKLSPAYSEILKAASLSSTMSKEILLFKIRHMENTKAWKLRNRWIEASSSIGLNRQPSEPYSPPEEVSVEELIAKIQNIENSVFWRMKLFLTRSKASSFGNKASVSYLLKKVDEDENAAIELKKDLADKIRLIEVSEAWKFRNRWLLIKNHLGLTQEKPESFIPKDGEPIEDILVKLNTMENSKFWRISRIPSNFADFLVRRK